MTAQPGAIPYLTADDVRQRLAPAGAVEALREALRAGLRPEADHARIAEPLTNGELLLMPAEAGADAGIKVLSLAPGNPARGLARIQGVYLLFDAETLTPRCLIDGPALTDLRTPAVSVAATLDVLRGTSAPLDVVLHGAGHQGLGHLDTLRDALAGYRPLGTVTAVVRRPDRVTSRGDLTRVVGAGSAEADRATAAAGVIVCATTAREPLFDGALVRDDAVVIAVGSHEPDARELPADLLSRAAVVVEDVATALRECGDVVLAVGEGAVSATDLVPMADVVTGRVSLPADRPVVFKSSGMSWEDLVVATAVAGALGVMRRAATR
ncbi:ornithine cyclodeaminase family protein [Promicromonospora kroppenstedtii]|uniref:Ornithine cyclodeaminase family protein n=1 Tax=Promicromonospora kroppenstedtii TaxID=440482 RepID=A0ABW7XP29_9MICO